MKKYFAMFRIRFITGLSYRAAAWAGVATQFCFGFMFIMVYRAFYDSAIVPPPMPFDQLVNYLWLQQAFLGLVALWYTDGELLDSITSGNIAYEMVRPYQIYNVWFARLSAKKLSDTLMRCLPILVIASFLPDPYRLTLPTSIVQWLAFLGSLSMSLLLSVSIAMFIYIITFYTMSPIGARVLIISGSDFLSGLIVPIPLMPLGMQRVLDFLPFRYVGDLPIRVGANYASPLEAGQGLLIQLVWVIALVALGSWAIGRALRRLVVQGG